MGVNPSSSHQSDFIEYTEGAISNHQLLFKFTVAAVITVLAVGLGSRVFGQSGSPEPLDNVQQSTNSGTLEDNSDNTIQDIEPNEEKSSSLDVKVNSNSVSSGETSKSSTSVKVNGQEVQTEDDGDIDETFTTTDNNSSVRIRIKSSNSSSAGGDMD